MSSLLRSGLRKIFCTAFLFPCSLLFPFRHPSIPTTPSLLSPFLSHHPSSTADPASIDKENANPTKSSDSANGSSPSTSHQPLKRPRLGDSTMNLFEQLTSVFHDVIASGGSGAAAQSPLRSIYASLVDNSAAVGMHSSMEVFIFL